MFFVVNSFNGSTFRAVKSAHSRLVANQNNAELSYVTMSMEDRRATSLITGRLAYNNSTNSWSLRPMAVSGEYLSEGAAREWSTVVSISIHPPSFKPVSLSLSRSPLSKTPKQVFFNPINILTLLHTLFYYYQFYFFFLTSTFIFTAINHI